MTGKHVIVIGGGIAGMEAASGLAGMGAEVTLVEKSSRLGGNVANWDRLFPSRRPAKEVIGYLENRLGNKVNVILETMAVRAEFNGRWRAHLSNSQFLEADALLLTTGFDLFEARRKEEYGYGIYDNVITSADLEKKFAGGGTIINAQGKVPDRVGFVHCVGSRDEKVGNLYCSRVCCVTAVKQAIEIRENIPRSEVYCFYMDLRMFGIDFEALYKEAQEKWGIHFIRGRLSESFENQDGSVLVKVEDTLANKPLKMNVDLLVLMAGMTPSASGVKLEESLNLPKDENRFLLPVDRQLHANETQWSGLFVAGTCTSPKSIDETLADARAAALRILQYFSRQSAVSSQQSNNRNH